MQNLNADVCGLPTWRWRLVEVPLVRPSRTALTKAQQELLLATVDQATRLTSLQAVMGREARVAQPVTVAAAAAVEGTNGRSGSSRQPSCDGGGLLRPLRTAAYKEAMEVGLSGRQLQHAVEEGRGTSEAD